MAIQTYRLHPIYWCAPVLFVLGAGALLWLAGSAFGFRGPESGILILLALGILGLAFWMALRMRHAFVLDDDGITCIAPGRRRFFTWKELRSIEDRVEGWGRHRQVVYRVKGQGGRSFRFTDGSVSNALGLASRIEDAIHENGQDARPLGSPESAPSQQLRSVLRKRYRESPRFVRVLTVVFVVAILLFTLWFDWFA